MPDDGSRGVGRRIARLGALIVASLATLAWAESAHADSTYSEQPVLLFDGVDATSGGEQGGLRFRWRGFNLDGGFVTGDDAPCLFDPLCANSAFQSSDAPAFQVGIGYSSGPWRFRIGYSRHEADPTPSALRDDGDEQVDVRIGFSLAPGVDSSLSYVYRATPDDAVVGNNSDAGALIWKLRIAFHTIPLRRPDFAASAPTYADHGSAQYGAVEAGTNSFHR